MDPRHKLTKSLDQLFVDKENPTIMSARTDDEAARNAATSGVTPDAIKQKLEQGLGATHVEIEDMSGKSWILIACTFGIILPIWLSHEYLTTATRPRANTRVGGCGQMFEAIIVSPQFTKKTTLARHRLVNAALKEEIAAIHAWTPKCYTPEQWEEKKPQ
jgi:stress-induced morphogen